MSAKESTVDKILAGIAAEKVSGKTIISDLADASAFITVGENDITLCPNEHTGTRINEDGISSLGKFSLNGTLSDFSIGGLWSLNDTLMSYVPSTAATPLPVFLPSNPLSSVVRFAKKLTALSEMM